MISIIYIEDNPAHFMAIKKLLQSDYYIIPSNEEEFNVMSTTISNGTVWNDFLESSIIENKDNLGLILMDLKLSDGQITGERLILKIRNDLRIPGSYFLPKLIPIISLTDYTTSEIAEQALNYGATHNIPKSTVIEEKNGKIFANDVAHFTSVITSMINYYNTAYFHRNLEELFKGIASDLQYQNKLIKSGFDNIELLIKGNEEEILQKFDILFKFLFESFDRDTKQRVFKTFPDDFKILLKGQIYKLNQGLWGKIKDAINTFNNNGGFKEFVDTVYKLLSEERIIDGKGKLIGIAIKGIFGILSSASST